MRAWREDLDFRELIVNDPEIRGRVPRAKIDRAFDLERQLKNIDKIFAQSVYERNDGDKERPSVRKKSAKKKPAHRKTLAISPFRIDQAWLPSTRPSSLFVGGGDLHQVADEIGMAAQNPVRGLSQFPQFFYRLRSNPARPPYISSSILCNSVSLRQALHSPPSSSCKLSS